jgi:hypothetical protein
MFCEVLPSHLHNRNSVSTYQCHQKVTVLKEVRAGAQEEELL